MTIRTVRDVQAMLSPIDPAAGLVSTLDRGDGGGADPLARILAAPREYGRRAVRPHRAVLAAAFSVVLVGAAAVTFDAVRPDPSAGYAATPPLLRYEPAASSLDVAALLRRLAEAAQRSTVKGSGDYEYISTRDWSPEIAESNGRGAWTIEPGEYQVWRRPTDNSGRTIIRYRGEPHGDAAAGDYGPGELPSFFCALGSSKSPCPVPTDPDGIRKRFITPSGPTVAHDGVQSPLGVIAYAAKDRLLPAATRAELWRMLADLPGISYTGRVKDRAGRFGEAFSVTVDAGIGPAHDTLIIDPDHGELLGYERNLQTVTNPQYFNDAATPPLKIRTPAVVRYTVFLTAELRPTSR
jgi:hypothetical protein